MRQRVFSGSPYEPTVGYCRAIRAGDRIFVSGTAPIDDDGGNACVGDPQGQARRCLFVALRAVRELGGDVRDVVRTRTFLTPGVDWKAAGRGHGEVFGEHPPTCTFVVVSALLDPEWVLEIEGEAIVEPLS